jgi:hypothetical protein
MPNPRRRAFMTFVGAAGFLVLEPGLLTALLAQTSGASPKFKPYPSGQDPNVPPEVEHRGNPDPKAIQRVNQIELRKDISKLYEMVSELKEELDKSDSSSTLSLSLVKKTEQIEKLAKQIKGLAKG